MMTQHEIPQGIRPVVWLAAIVIGGAFYTTDHDTNMSTLEGFAYSADHLSALTRGGNTSRQLAYLALGSFGAALLVSAGRKPYRLDGLLFPLVCGFVLWLLASVTWSIAPEITLRRLFVFLCCLAGTAGVVRALQPREIVLLACVVSSSFLLVGVGTECLKGTFHPWTGDYRFAGTLHPNAQGMNLAVVCLSSFVLAVAPGRSKLWPLFLGLCATGLIFLLLTRSRTATAGTLLGLVSIWSLRTPLPRIVVQSVLLGALGLLMAMFAAGLGGHATGQKIEETILLGRAQDAGSLTGRVPLWNELLRYVVERPLTGYGHDTFWTPQHIHAVSSSQDWGIHEAHSSYLEVLLNLGFVGLLLIMLPVTIGLFAAILHYGRTGHAEYGFITGLYLFGLIDGVTESGMTMPNFVPFMAACGLLLLALAPQRQAVDARVSRRIVHSAAVNVSGVWMPEVGRQPNHV